MLKDSCFKFYSLGIVAIDKPTNSYEINVVPVEHIVDQEGDINATTDYKADTKNHKDVPYKAETKSSSVIKAKWLPINNSNRMSAPDVIKGESVMIYTFSDTNEYYWSTIFNEPEIRRLEKVLYGFSNLSTGARSEYFDRNSSYWYEVDTLNKYIKIHTSDNDGEATTYDITIDTKAGSITVIDGFNNYLLHDSVKGTLTAKYNTEINIIAPTVNIVADTINANATNFNTDSNNIDINSDHYNLSSDSINNTGSVTNNGNTYTSGVARASSFQEG